MEGQQPVSHRKNLLSSSQELLSKPFVFSKKAPTPIEQTEEKVDRTAKKKIGSSSLDKSFHSQEIKTRKAIDNAKKIETSNSQKINTRKAVTPKVQQEVVPPSIEKTGEKVDRAAKKIGSPISPKVSVPKLKIEDLKSNPNIPRLRRNTDNPPKVSETTKALVSPRYNKEDPQKNKIEKKFKSWEEESQKGKKSNKIEKSIKVANPIFKKEGADKIIRKEVNGDLTREYQGPDLQKELVVYLFEELNKLPPPVKCPLKELKCKVEDYWLQNIQCEGVLFKILQTRVLIPDSIEYVIKLQAKFCDLTRKHKSPMTHQLEKFFEELVGPYTPQKNEGEKENGSLEKERNINIDNFLNINNRIKVLVKETRSKELGRLLKKILPYKNNDKRLEYIKSWNLNHGTYTFEETLNLPTSFLALPPEDIVRSIIPDGTVLPTIIINDVLYFKSGQIETRSHVIETIIQVITASGFRKKWLKHFYNTGKNVENEQKEMLPEQMENLLKKQAEILQALANDTKAVLKAELDKLLNPKNIKEICDEIILPKNVNWEGLKEFFREKFKLTEANWENVRKDIETLEINMNSKQFTTELMRRLVPSLDVLQFIPVNALFESRVKYSEAFPVLYEKKTDGKELEKKEVILTLNGNDGDRANFECKFNVNKDGYSINRTLQLGLFEFNPKFPNNKDIKLANILVDVNVNSTTDLYSAHQVNITCSNLQVTPTMQEKGQKYANELIKRLSGTNFMPKKIQIRSKKTG